MPKNRGTAELPVKVEAVGASEPIREGELGTWKLIIWGLVAAGSLYVAYASAMTSFLVLVYLFALVQMARARTWRHAFYGGLAVGLLIGLLRLDFFWRIFSGGAVALWIVFAFWIGLFVALARLYLKRKHGARGHRWAWIVIPCLWCGLEYFRSELYYLRFAWLSPGFAFGHSPNHVPFGTLGAYGVGFLGMSFASVSALFWGNSKWKAAVVLIAGAAVLRVGGALSTVPAEIAPQQRLEVAGVQMEFPTEKEVVVRLKEAIRKHPEAKLLVLSEYTFTEPVPDRVLKWCQDNRRYLVVGGKDPISKDQFYNTAFVISPEGKVVFQQVKSVPIQFFKDGLPAREQRVWNSPWGKIGICICYDLSYSRVTDRLVKLGAEALIVPTMDVFDWGIRQHELHALVAPVRAAEYGLPIFRVASSGVSQLVDCHGQVLARTSCPGDGELIAGCLEFRGPGHVPLDRWLVLLDLAVTAGTVLEESWRRLKSLRPKAARS